MTLQDEFLVTLEDAAKQVGPVAGLDGAAMAHRAVRRERARRATLSGVGAVALAGAIAGGTLVMAPVPETGPATGDVPAGWTPVSAGGVTLAVPPELEASGEAGGLWTAGETFVQVVPLDDDAPLAPQGSGLRPFDLDVPGAASAEYVKEPQLETSAQEFVGTLDVHLESGDAVRVSLVWTDRGEGEEIFADLLRSVAVVDATDLPQAPEAARARPLDGFVAGVPDGWSESELAGLTYAVPRSWAEDEASGTAFPAGSRVRTRSADGAASLAITQSADAATWDPDETMFSNVHPTYTFPLEGADVVWVDPRPGDGVLQEQVRIRREGGRGYLLDIEVPDTAEGRALALQLVGTLGFADGSRSPSDPEDLPPFPTSDVPHEWTEARWESLGLSVPPEWADVSTPDGGAWVSDPDAASPDEKVSVSAGSLDRGGKTTSAAGYSHDVPGADQTVVQAGEERGDDGRSTFLGTVELVRGDQSVVLEYSGPAGGDSRARFGMLVQSLELSAG